LLDVEPVVASGIAELDDRSAIASEKLRSVSVSRQAVLAGSGGLVSAVLPSGLSS